MMGGVLICMLPYDSEPETNDGVESINNNILIIRSFFHLLNNVKVSYFWCVIGELYCIKGDRSERPYPFIPLNMVSTQGYRPCSAGDVFFYLNESKTILWNPQADQAGIHAL